MQQKDGRTACPKQWPFLLPTQQTIAYGHTTHLVASDQSGNMVSITQSVGPLMGIKSSLKEKRIRAGNNHGALSW